jgi:hypothetical protein
MPPQYGNEFDVYTRSLSQYLEAARIGGEEVLTVRGRGHHRDVNRIGQAATRKQHARTPPRAIIRRCDVGPGQQPGHSQMPPSPFAPHLGDHAVVAHRHPARQAFSLDQRHHIPVAALDRHERPASGTSISGAPRSHA